MPFSFIELFCNQGIGHKKCIPLGTKQNTIFYRFLPVISVLQQQDRFSTEFTAFILLLESSYPRSCWLVVTNCFCQLTFVLHPYGSTMLLSVCSYPTDRRRRQYHIWLVNEHKTYWESVSVSFDCRHPEDVIIFNLVSC